MANPIVVKGVDRRVEFDGETVTIHLDVFARFRAKVRRGDASDRVLPIDEIAAVDLVESTTMWNGHLRFILVEGDDEDDRPSPPTAAATARLASRDPLAVMFSRYQADAFAGLHDAVTAAIAERDAR